MAYIGRAVEYGSAYSDHFEGDGSADYTLTYETTTDGVVVSQDGVLQRNKTDFNVVGTTLTFTSVVPVTSPTIKIMVIYTGLTLAIGKPGAVTVDSTEIVAGAIDLAHMSVNSVDSDQYVDGSIDTAHIATNQIDETLMKDAFVADFTEVTIATGDSLLLGDISDSGATKRDTVGGLLDLVPGLNVKIGHTTVDISSTSTLAISGAGFTPTVLVLRVNIDGDERWTLGWCTSAANDYAMNSFLDTASGVLNATAGLGRLQNDGSNYSNLTFSTFDSDGVDIVFTLSGTVSGTADVKYMLLG